MIQGDAKSDLRTTRSAMTRRRNFAMALACALTLSACASPIAPSAKPANFYEAVRSDVEAFWAGFFSSRGGAYTPIAKMQLFDVPVVTACGQRSPDEGPFYCRLDRSVYLESGFMQNELSKYGDFASAVVVAHEIG